MTRWGAQYVGLMAAISMVLAGCSSNAPDGEVASSASSVTSSAAVATGMSPLDEYLDPSGMPVDAGEFAVWQRKVQELVAACMQEEGFDYLPVDYANVFPPLPVTGGTERDNILTYGYYITTIDPNRVDPSLAARDPNEEIVAAMSSSEQSAYYAALYGNPIEVVSTGGPEQTGTLPSVAGAVGCLPQAQEATDGFPRAQVAGFDELLTAQYELQLSIDQDPRLDPVIEEWSLCLAAKGFDSYVEPYDARNDVYQQWADLKGFAIEFNGSGEPYVSYGETDVALVPDTGKLAELKRFETDVAVADYDCKADYRVAYEEVRFDLETKFVAAHLDELTRYRDQINGG